MSDECIPHAMVVFIHLDPVLDVYEDGEAVLIVSWVRNQGSVLFKSFSHNHPTHKIPRSVSNIVLNDSVSNPHKGDEGITTSVIRRRPDIGHVVVGVLDLLIHVDKKNHF